MKRRFLVSYDYGMGGVWAYLLAESEADIAARYPELVVVPDAPEWLSTTEAERLEASLTIDIDDPSAPILKQLLASRS